MYNIGIYARYSTADQAATSIEDQIRRCRNTIKSKGLLVSKEYVFQDKAISGSASVQSQRAGYNDLINAIKSKKINLLVVDEISRLSRNSSQVFGLKDLIREHQVRLITVDGIDSQAAEWEILVGLGGILAQEEIDNVRFLTVRGMVGQLERGYMLAAPAYGYRRVRVDAAGQPARNEEEVAGTLWEVSPVEADVVKNIYGQRASGTTLSKIARKLNQQKVLPPRPRDGSKSLWLGSTVSNIIRNPIYRGDFVYRGSASYRYSSKKAGLIADNKAQTFSRPHLRLVDDSLWHQCNKVKGYTGQKTRSDHLLAGLVTCGICGGNLSLTSPSHTSRVLYCSACASRKAVSPDLPAQTSGAGVDGVLELLGAVIKQVVADPDVLIAYRERLADKLKTDDMQAVTRLRKEIRIQEKAYQGIFAQYISSGDDTLVDSISRLFTCLTTMKEECRALEQQILVTDPDNIRKQQEITTEEIIHQLLQDTQHLARLRPILKKLFPVIEFCGRTPKKACLFEIHMDIGVAVATATNSEEIEEHVITAQYTVQASHTRPTTWKIDRLCEVIA